MFLIVLAVLAFFVVIALFYCIVNLANAGKTIETLLGSGGLLWVIHGFFKLCEALAKSLPSQIN